MSKLKKDPVESLEIYRRLFPFIRPYRLRLVVGIICGMLYGGALGTMIVVMRWALGGISGEDISVAGIASMGQGEMSGSAGEVGVERIILTVMLLTGVTIFQGIVFFCGKYLVEWVGNRVITDLRGALFEHIHSLPIQFFGKSRTGDLISRVTSDTGLLAQLVTNVIGDVIREPFTMIGLIGALVVLDWKLSIMALLVFPICIVPVALLGRRVRKASKRGQESSGDLLSASQESINGAVVVKAFQMEEEEITRFNRFNMHMFKMAMKQTRARSLNEPIITVLSSVGLSGVVVYAYLHNLSLALLGTFALAMVSMYKPAKKLSQIHMRIQRAAPGAERVFEILDVENSISNVPDAVPFVGHVQDIVFRNVSFAYDEKKILDGINLESKAGQCIALVGSSGAGKTTLVNLIPRFFDVTDGAVCLNGKDLRSYTVKSLRSLIGMVTQDTVLFNRSVAENIAYGSKEATREQIEDAARRANAHAFIVQLEDGYDTVIGERGSRLSGGMAQRVAIARALLKNPPILILDEATSALDTESERLVQGALDELMKNRTVFVIAHRLSTVAHADNIVVLDQGKIIEQGTHAELLSMAGKYKYLYDIQFANASSD